MVGSLAGGNIRIIPARAGFTGFGRTAEEVLSDHPRSRGVYVRGVLNIADVLGSSPLARGLLSANRLGRPGRGIIPARAGFTPRYRPPDRPHRDHPRSRGVYCSPVGVALAIMGSSPLARGLPAAVSRRPPIRGIIPARAGFTQAAVQRVLRRSDHPRSRGVYHRRRGPGYGV